MITRRTRTHEDMAELSIATMEAYLDHRFVGDATFTRVGQNDIATAFITRFVADTPNNPGIPIRVQQTTPGPGILRDRTYEDHEDRTAYSALTALAGVESGPEWTVEWQWSDQHLMPVFVVGDHIGAKTPPGIGPATWFTLPGSVLRVSVEEDYTSGHAANRVLAVSTADGDKRPQSTPHIANTGWPTFEHRFTPSTSITNISTLNA
jgi:hypothetical protein